MKKIHYISILFLEYTTISSKTLKMLICPHYFKILKCNQLTLRIFILCFFTFPQLAIGSNDPKKPVLIYYEDKAYGVDDLLSKYLQINSISGSEMEAGEFLKNICIENGLHITQMGEQNGNYNFTASIFPLEDNKPNIIFLNHLDVVPAGDNSLWVHPPFSGKITETEIWGRGAFDNKGAAIIQLFSIIEISKRYKNKPVNYNFSFLSVSCEETQCDGGIKYVIENYLTDLNPAVVLGEGPPAIKGLIEDKPELALFGISVAQKRALWLELNLEIKTNGHSSVTPFQYANKEMVIALNKLLIIKPEIIFNDINTKLLKQLGKLNGGLKGYALRHPKLFKKEILKKLQEDPLLLALFSNTITLTSIKDENGEVNTIPSKVKAILDCRLLPNESSEVFINELKIKLDNDAIEINIIKEMKDGGISPTDTSFFRHLETAILKRYPKSKAASVLLPSSNDIAAFREHNILAYSLIPIKLERKYLETVHNYNERIPKGVLEKGVHTYIEFMELCIAD